MKEPSKEVKEVERRYEETIDEMQQLVDRLKTERMSQAEFEQYAKEHGYIISTTNIIEQIRDEIKQTTSRYSIAKERGGMGQVEWSDRLIKESDVLQIIDRYTKGE